MKKEKGTFGWIFIFAGQKKSGYIASVIFAVIGAAFQILPFFVMAQVIGKLLAGNKDLAGYLIDCAVMAVFWLLRVLLHSLSTAQSHKATFAVLGNIRKQGLAKLAKMPLGDVQAKGSGELKNILVERVDSIEPTLAHAIPEMSSNAAVALATLIYLFVIDWRMALASLITFPLGMVFFMLMMAGYEKNYARTVAATNTLNDTAVEYIGGIEGIKAFGKAKNSYEKFVIAAKECAQSYIDWMNKSNFYFTFAMNIMPATLLSVLPIGGLLLKNGTLTPEKFVLIVILSTGLITPIIGCMKFTDDLAKVGTIISQVTDILTAPELSRPETDTESPQGSTVELRDVHFGYNDAEVLHGIDLVFPEGTVNALVGPSGSGKSTLLNMIGGLDVPTSGKVIVDGRDLSTLKDEQLTIFRRRKIGFIFQNYNLVPVLNVFENIVLPVELDGNKVDKKFMKEVVRMLGLEDKLNNMPSNLSGGQQQRVAIARALVSKPAIVLADEPTGNLDSMTSSDVLSLLKVTSTKFHQTLVMITHNNEIAQLADRIIRIEDGRISE